MPSLPLENEEPVAVSDATPPAAPAPPLLIRSPKPAPRLQTGDPPRDMRRIEAFRDEPSTSNERYARELIERCGPLVLDGVQYRVENGRVLGVPRAYLGLDRQATNVGIEPMQVTL